MEKYGLKWKPGTTSLEIEMYMIRKGGRFDHKGAQVGEGLFHHYRALQSLLWPEEDHHRWSDLQLSKYIQNTITVCSGVKDSGKTRSAGKFVLCDYYVHPDDTLVICSSTTLQALELRIWGDIKSLHVRAKKLWPELPGSVIDSKHAITTDDLSDEDLEARDMRRGLLCILEGSLVDTPSGPVPIESISVGDRVLNACGSGVVEKVYVRECSEILEIKLQDGRFLRCTSEHPILTKRGWVKAVDITTCDVVLSSREALSILRKSTRAGVPKQKTLQRLLPEVRKGAEVRVLQGGVQAMEPIRVQVSLWEVLLNGVRGSVGVGKRDSGEEDCQLQSLRKVDGKLPHQSGVLLGNVQGQAGASELCDMRSRVHVDTADCREVENYCLLNELQEEVDWEACGGPWWSSEGSGGVDCSQVVSGGDSSVQNFHRHSGNEIGTLVRAGSCVAEQKGLCGDRREHSQLAYEAEKRREEAEDSGGSRVESVSVYCGPGESGNRQSGGKHKVYNFHVSGHPSYSVNGVLVHNCIAAKKSSGGVNDISNYVGIKQKRKRWVADEYQFMPASMTEAMTNANSGDFKGIFLGNPIGEGDPLDVISEPKCGWENFDKEFPDTSKTMVWDNKFGIDSQTITLIGTDSPNFDYPETEPIRYKYLINRNSIKRVIGMGYGPETPQFWSQCVGLRRPMSMAKRVLSIQLCEDKNAFQPAIWKGSKPTIKIGALDAAYGGTGGDRCVAGWGEFGEDVDGRYILRVNTPVLVPVSVKRSQVPEDQIAEWCADYFPRNGVKAVDFFYDSTGRGSLGPAFARIWSNQIQPVEFGGSATSRPMNREHVIEDPKTLKMRVKRCNEEYFNFVTELWFSTRRVIEAGQMRELPRDVAKEGTQREWKIVAGNKIQVERKDEMRERIGVSPDLFDWLVTLVEGARRRGFQITNMATAETDGRSVSAAWLSDWKRDALKKQRAGELVE